MASGTVAEALPQAIRLVYSRLASSSLMVADCVDTACKQPLPPPPVHHCSPSPLSSSLLHLQLTVLHTLNSHYSTQPICAQVRTSEKTPILTCLLEGPTGTGKTALAATIGIDSQFPYVKLISAENMVGFSEQAKAAQIAKVFDDAYRVRPLTLRLPACAVKGKCTQGFAHIAFAIWTVVAASCSAKRIAVMQSILAMFHKCNAGNQCQLDHKTKPYMRMPSSMCT